MAGILVIFLLAGVLAFVPALIDGWAVREGASPETLVVLAAVTMLGIAAVPITFAICTGTLAPHSPDRDALSVASVAGLLLVALTAGRTLARMIAIRRRWAALARVSAALELCEEPGGVKVLPLQQLLAFVSGTDAFISQGLIDRLTPKQRRVVVEHEREHAERGHARTLAVAHALRHGMFGLPAARHAAAVLNREIDVLADRAAARRLGDRRAVQDTLRGVAWAVSEQHDGDLDIVTPERLERLARSDRPRRPLIDAVVRLAALLLGAFVLASICLSIHTGSLWLGIAACALVVAGFASFTKPLLAHRPPRAEKETCDG